MREIRKSGLTKKEIREKILSYKKPLLKHIPFEERARKYDGADFDFDDFSKLSYDDQTKLFNAIKEVFADLREKAGIANNNTYMDLFYRTFTEVLEIAVAGNVAAMDYLCFLYKRGVENFVPINMVLAHQWGMLAMANGSKLSPDRLRLFMDPVYVYVVETGLVDKMIDKNNVEDGEGAYFVAQNFAEMYTKECGITLLDMARKNPLDNSVNFHAYLKEQEKKRDEVLPKMMKFLVWFVLFKIWF